MLQAYPTAPGAVVHSQPVLPESAAEAVWFDLVNPDEAERRAVERITGHRLPTRAQIDEIESSSRLYREGDALYLSTPVISRGLMGEPDVSSVGFVLSERHLVTIRFANLVAFQSFADTCGRVSGRLTSAMAAFLGLMEAVVDRLADVLEEIGARLDHISDAVFHVDESQRLRGPRADAALRKTLGAVGRMGDHISKIRDSLLGVGRINTFVAQTAREWIPEELARRFRTLRADIESLRDYDEHLTTKVQFLLDATLGFINIEQNNIVKILTIASVVGIPPVLMAGIWGMNFKNMPELNWTWGYPFAWGVIILSGLIPLAWFKIRRWI